MSKVLGPIHYWLYHKIELQYQWQKRLVEKTLSSEQSLKMNENINYACGQISEGALEDLVEDSIHEWLSKQVSIVERRLAYTVTKLLAQPGVSLSFLMEKSFEFGLDHPIMNSKIDDVFNEIKNRLLNGMPCDRIEQVIVQTKHKITWKEARPIHLEYWQLMDGDIANYYQLLEQLVKGMLANTDFTFNFQNGIFELIRRGHHG